MDEEMDGIATGLSNVICKDGQTTVTANIPFNNRKITGLGDATAAADALNRQSGDARYLQRPSALTALTDLADDDVFGVFDLSASGDRGVAYASLKTELTTDFMADGRMFPVGTRMVFQQTTPPTGWTKATGAAYNDAALRFTTGTAGTGGTQSYNAVFKSWTFTGTVGNDTPSIAKTASHDHNIDLAVGSADSIATGSGRPEYVEPRNFYTANTGGSTAHNHTLTMNAANFDVKYVEMCVAQKA